MTRALATLLLLALSSPILAQTERRVQKGPIGAGRVGDGAISSKMQVAKDLDQQLAKWKPVRMPYNSAKLTPRERQMVEKLVQACQLIESAFWRQSDPTALTIYNQLAGSTHPQDQKLRRLLFINGSRFNQIDHNKPFIGTEPMPPGRALYPVGLTREQIEEYVKAHPEQKDEIYSGYTVIRKNGDQLAAIPYNIAYRDWVAPAARLLREAADLSADKDFATFLRMRAAALLTDDYYKSDLAWVDLNDPKFDVVFAPYETYLDEILGVKTSYGVAVLIRNDEESKKLAVFQRYVPDIQDSLPLAPEDKPSKHGKATPMEVVDSPFRAGDFVHGYQAVATNLPNDPRIHQEKGTKKIFFKNFMDARVNYVILPLAKRLMDPQQAALASGEGYLEHTLMHEIAHGIGPAFARVGGKQVDIREAIGPIYSALEETKADVVGMYALIWLMEKGHLPKEKARELYASYLAGNLRSVRFGVGEAHGRAEMSEFNYMVEKGVYVRDANGRYRVNFDKVAPAIQELTKELLEIEATGDRARAEAYFAKYDKMPVDLKNALDAITDIPVDIYPEYSWTFKVR